MKEKIAIIELKSGDRFSEYYAHKKVGTVEIINVMPMKILYRTDAGVEIIRTKRLVLSLIELKNWVKIN